MDPPYKCKCCKKNIRKRSPYNPNDKEIKQDYFNGISKFIKYKKAAKLIEEKIKTDKKDQIIPIEKNYIKTIRDLGCVNSNVYITDIIPVNVKMGKFNESDTPFQSSVYLTSNVNLYNISATAAGYSSVNFSTEGLLWTLWPLTQNVTKYNDVNLKNTYFDQISMGTSLTSRYPIGQMGFFTSQSYVGNCTPMSASIGNAVNGLNTGGNSQPGLLKSSPAIAPGVQGLGDTLTAVTPYSNNVALIVIKISEEISRIINPISGAGSNEKFIYVGYDAWSIFNISTNPIGPVMATTYISPQTVTGSVTENNLQVIIPPNFPTTMYFKNTSYMVPLSSNAYLND